MIQRVFQRNSSKFKMTKCTNKGICNLMLLISLIQLVSHVASFHLPYELMKAPNTNPLSAFGDTSEFASPTTNRRQDDDSSSDYDEMTPKASEAHQNNDDNNGDGYGETENEGPYEETPRDQEGQADLERFFDDHLGASDKDGMDKENLPTNIVESIASVNTFQQLQSQPDQQQSNPIQVSHEENPAFTRQNEMLSYLKKRRSLLGADKADIQEPYKTKLVITRQVEDDGLRRRANVTIGQYPIITDNTEPQDQLASSQVPINRMPIVEPNRIAREAEVRASEDEEMDKVYVTNRTDGPFKIEALGGYDPEEDFENATQDLDGNTSRSVNYPKRQDEEAAQSSDSSDNQSTKFNDPEVEALFNDASETDETLAADEPDWGDDKPDRDLSEERLRRRAAACQNNADDQDDDYSPQPAASERAQNDQDEQDNDQDNDEDTEPDLEREQSERNQADARRRADKDDDTSWVNDGVDDMEIPSKSDQERAIQKAAQRDAAIAAQRHQQQDEDELARSLEAAPSDPEQQQDPTDVRMPNADYLKEDMKDLEDDANR